MKIFLDSGDLSRGTQAPAARVPTVSARVLRGARGTYMGAFVGLHPRAVMAALDTRALALASNGRAGCGAQGAG